MPIIIKEVIVRTTVESKKTPQEIFPGRVDGKDEAGYN